MQRRLPLQHESSGNSGAGRAQGRRDMAHRPGPTIAAQGSSRRHKARQPADGPGDPLQQPPPPARPRVTAAGDACAEAAAMRAPSAAAAGCGQVAGEGRDGDGGVGVGVGEELAAGAAVAHVVHGAGFGLLAHGRVVVGGGHDAGQVAHLRPHATRVQ
jgi:hypothetical protein